MVLPTPGGARSGLWGNHIRVSYRFHFLITCQVLHRFLYRFVQFFCTVLYRFCTVLYRFFYRFVSFCTVFVPLWIVFLPFWIVFSSVLDRFFVPFFIVFLYCFLFVLYRFGSFFACIFFHYLSKLQFQLKFPAMHVEFQTLLFVFVGSHEFHKKYQPNWSSGLAIYSQHMYNIHEELYFLDDTFSYCYNFELLH